MTYHEEKILKTIGETLYKRRLELGISKYRLSKLSGIQPTHITLIEKGLINPTVETVEQLAKALKLQISISNI